MTFTLFSGLAESRAISNGEPWDDLLANSQGSRGANVDIDACAEALAVEPALETRQQIKAMVLLTILQRGASDALDVAELLGIRARLAFDLIDELLAEGLLRAES